MGTQKEIGRFLLAATRLTAPGRTGWVSAHPVLVDATRAKYVQSQESTRVCGPHIHAERAFTNSLFAMLLTTEPVDCIVV